MEEKSIPGMMVGGSSEIDPIYAQQQSPEALEKLRRRLRGFSGYYPLQANPVKEAAFPVQDPIDAYALYRKITSMRANAGKIEEYVAPPGGSALDPEPNYVRLEPTLPAGVESPSLSRLLKALQMAGTPAPHAVIKQADHPQERLEQRTSLPANYTHRLRKVLAKTTLPKGDVYARMPDNSYAVFKDAGGKKRLASFLSKHMTPRGRDVTAPVREGLKTAGSRLRELVTVAPVPNFPSVWRMLLNGKEIGEARLAEGADGIIARIKNMDMYHKYHGMGLGKKFYGEIMRSMPGGALASDIGTVSPHARRVWRGMRDRGYNLWENTAGELNPAGTELLHDEFRQFHLRKAPDFIAELPASAPAGPHSEIFKDIRRVVPLKNSEEELAALASGRERDRVLLEEDKKDRLRALLEKRNGLKTAATAVIIKGNPEYIEGNPKADAYYSALAEALRGNGYDTSFDPGEDFTTPPPADLWVGHSRGAGRLKFAPPGTKTLDIGPLEHEKAREHAESQKALAQSLGLTVGTLPKELRTVPPDEHYQITPELLEALRGMAKTSSAFDVRELTDKEDLLKAIALDEGYFNPEDLAKDKESVLASRLRNYTQGNKKYTLFGAFDGANLVGMSRVREEPFSGGVSEGSPLQALADLGAHASINSTVVLPEYRRRGLAEALRRLEQEKYDSLLTGVGPKSDVEAMEAFNSKTGFKRILDHEGASHWYWSKGKTATDLSFPDEGSAPTVKTKQAPKGSQLRLQQALLASKTAGFANEDLAQKAHQAVLDEYGLTEADGSKYWKLKTAIYKKMGGTFTKHAGLLSWLRRKGTATLNKAAPLQGTRRDFLTSVGKEVGTRVSEDVAEHLAKGVAATAPAAAAASVAAAAPAMTRRQALSSLGGIAALTPSTQGVASLKTLDNLIPAAASVAGEGVIGSTGILANAGKDLGTQLNQPVTRRSLLDALRSVRNAATSSRGAAGTLVQAAVG